MDVFDGIDSRTAVPRVVHKIENKIFTLNDQTALCAPNFSLKKKRIEK